MAAAEKAHAVEKTPMKRRFKMVRAASLKRGDHILTLTPRDFMRYLTQNKSLANAQEINCTSGAFGLWVVVLGEAHWLFDRGEYVIKELINDKTN